MDHKHKPIRRADVLEKIAEYLRHHGGRKTSVREEVVDVLLRVKTPRTVYELLGIVNKNRKPALSAISLYRTLEFLIAAGVAVKLESRNAYELCLNNNPEHSHLVMICDACGEVRELEERALGHALAKTARQHGHILKHPVIELHGTCKDC